MLFAVFLLAGCTAPSSGGLLGEPTVPPETAYDDDDDAVDDDDDAIEHPPDDFEEDGDGSWFFPQDRILTVDIELHEGAYVDLQLDPYGWTSADVRFDGRIVHDVGIRLRGRIGSFRPVGGKPKWRFDFNRFRDQRRIEGLEALSLDNNVVDCSGLKQVLGSHVLGLAGTTRSRMGFAQVTLNGEPYGVYNTIEVQDDRFTKRVWPDGDGNLYDGAYTWFGDRDVRFADFTAAGLTWFELEEGEDVAGADLERIQDAVRTALLDGDLSVMASVVDMPQFQRYIAAEYWIGQNDGYVLNRNNYRVYFTPEDGLARFASYDLDYAFLWNPWNATWDAPAGALAAACIDDPTCLNGIRGHAADILEIIEATDLHSTFDAWDAVTGEAARTDPKAECGGAQVDARRDELRGWIDQRGAAMRAQWQLP